MKPRLLTFCLLLSALWLAAWTPKSQVSSRLAQALAVAVADTDSIVRAAPVPLPKSDTARRYIKLLPGFEVIPQNGQFYVATIDTARRPNAADTSCFIRIKSLAANGQETNQLPRLNGTLQALTLSVQDLAPAGFWNTGAVYSWTTPTGATATTSTLTAPIIGNYGLTLTKNGRTCQATTVLRGSACQVYDTVYACNPNANLPAVPDDPNNRLSNLAAGDTVYAGDFIAVILSVEGGNANSGWTGQAKVRVPYLGQELLTTFENAKFNTCYQLTSGSKLESVYDPTNLQGLDVEAILRLINQYLADLSDLKANFSGSASDTAQLARLGTFVNLLSQKINNEFSLHAADKQIAINKLDSLNTYRIALMANPVLCTNGASGGRLAAGSCPLTEMESLLDGIKKKVDKADKDCGTTHRFQAMYLQVKQNDYNNWGYALGVYAHVMIAQAYEAGLADKTGLVKEYKMRIPAGFSLAGIKYADIVNLRTGEIFEIKPQTKRQDAISEVNSYVGGANANCLQNLMGATTFRKGTSGFPIGQGNAKEIPIPFYNTVNKIRFWLQEDGVVLYDLVKNLNPRLEFQPVGVRKTVPDDYFDFVKRLLLKAVDGVPASEIELEAYRYFSQKTTQDLINISLTIGAGALIGIAVQELITLGFATPAAVAEALVAASIITVTVNIIQTRTQ